MIKRRYERGDIVAFRYVCVTRSITPFPTSFPVQGEPLTTIQRDEYRSPQEYGKLLVKRLIALPGDKVAWISPLISPLSNLSFISPAPSDTNQVKTLPPYPDTEVVLPEGHGWLEGDAPFDSEDSNHFGPVGVVYLFPNATPTVDQVPLALIDSKLTCIIWPLNRVSAIDSHSTGTQAERVQVVELSRT